MAFGYDDAVVAAIIIGEYIYHRWFDEPPKPQPAEEISLPRVDDGAPYPILYGRTRVRTPVIAWCDTPIYDVRTADNNLQFVFLPPPNNPQVPAYFLSMMLVLGIPFEAGEQKLLSMWAGDVLMQRSTSADPNLSDLVGDGSDFGVRIANVSEPSPSTLGAFGAVEFLDGNPTQRLVDVGSGDPLSEAGRHMTESATGTDPWASLYGGIPVAFVPGYRGFISVFLYGLFQFLNTDEDIETLYHWCIGTVPSVPQYSFEVQSLPGSWWGPVNNVPVHEGDITRDAGDANPMDVLYDLLASPRGRLNIDPHLIDTSTLITAAATLYSEGIGYSNAIDGNKSARDIIDDMMRLIDGVIYQDPTDGTIKVKLIRNDYDPSSLLVVSPSTGGLELQNFASSGWTDVPNKVRISFPDRALNYNDNSGVALNEANALGQNGETREIQIRMEACKEIATANILAERELAARCRPLIKCTVFVDRTFRLVCPGDCVMLNWPEKQISGAVMRVAAVSRGALDDGKIKLDLIQDYFYVWRSQPPAKIPGGLALKTPGSLSIGFR